MFLSYICSYLSEQSDVQPRSTKQTITSHLKPLNTKKTMTYANGNPAPGLGQEQKMAV
jgi:hypothetical protein